MNKKIALAAFAIIVCIAFLVIVISRMIDAAHQEKNLAMAAGDESYVLQFRPDLRGSFGVVPYNVKMLTLEQNQAVNLPTAWPWTIELCHLQGGYFKPIVWTKPLRVNLQIIRTATGHRDFIPLEFRGSGDEKTVCVDSVDVALFSEAPIPIQGFSFVN